MFAGHSGTSSSLSARAGRAAGAADAPRATGRPRSPAREPGARGALDRRPSARRAAAPPARRARECWRAAQRLDQLAGVDPERAGEHAGAVGGAGLERVVLVLARAAPRAPASPAGWRAISRRRTIRWRGVVVRSRLGQTGSQKPHSTQVVDLLLDRRRRLQVAQVDARVVVEHDPGREHAVGVGEPLDPPHQLGRLRAPLALDERRHVDPGAVLGLERAVVLVDDQLDQLLHEGVVALEVLGLGEVRGEHEVQVPGRGVAGDPGEEAVLAEQRLQVACATRRSAPGGTQTSSTISAVPGRAHLADQAVQALAHRPVDLDRLRVAVEVGLADQLVAGEHLGRPRLGGVELGVVGAAELDQQRRRGRVELAPALRACRGCCGWRRSAPARPSARPRARRRRRSR